MKTKVWAILAVLGIATSSGCAQSPARPGTQDSQLAPAPQSGIDLASIEFLEMQPAAHGSAIRNSLANDFAITALTRARDVIAAYPDLRFVILGFTDANECTGEQCIRLSLRRATAVRSWLVANGVRDASLLPPAGKGSEFPLERGSSKAERTTNQRVEIHVVP